jgi:hypothetical protein
MNKVFIICVVVAAVAVAGCRTTTDNRDYMLGWYSMPSRHPGTREVIPDHPSIIIPIFKVYGEYHSSMFIGMEVPLEPCPEGLAVSEGFGLDGTKIKYDEETSEVCISVCQPVLEFIIHNYVKGETNVLTRIDRPSWIMDATAIPPSSNDEFIGWYQSALSPWVGFEVRKVAETTELSVYAFGDEKWSPLQKGCVVGPHAGRLGFFLPLGKEHHLEEQSIIYNKHLKRYEMNVIVKKSSRVIRTPLVKTDKLTPPLSEDNTTVPMVQMGIPYSKP